MGLKDIATEIDSVIKENENLMSISPFVIVVGEIIKNTKKDWKKENTTYSLRPEYRWSNKKLKMSVNRHNSSYTYSDDFVEINGKTIFLNSKESNYLTSIIS